MAYTWLDIDVGSYTIDGVVDEIHSNINNLHVLLELSEPDWSYDAEDDMKIDDAHMKEMETKILYAHEQNWCRNHYGSYNTSDLDLYYNSEKGGRDLNVYESHNLTVIDRCTAHFTTHYVSRLHEHKADRFSGHYYLQKTTYDYDYRESRNIDDKIGENIDVLKAKNISDESIFNTSHDGSRYSDYDSSEKKPHDTTFNTDDKSTLYKRVYEILNSGFPCSLYYANHEG